MIQSIRSVSIALTVCLALSCSDSKSNPTADGGDGAGECPSFTPCGGDLVGVWVPKTGCVTPRNSFSGVCPESIMIKMSEGFAKDTIEFKTGGLYSSRSADVFTYAISIPESCYSGSTCSAFLTANTPDPVLGMVVWGGIPVPSSVTCGTSETMVTMSYSDGNYTTSGTSYTINIPGIRNYTAPYCVSGNTMTSLVGGQILYTFEKQ